MGRIRTATWTELAPESSPWWEGVTEDGVIVVGMFLLLKLLEIVVSSRAAVILPRHSSLVSSERETYKSIWRFKSALLGSKGTAVTMSNTSQRIQENRFDEDDDAFQNE